MGIALDFYLLPQKFVFSTAHRLYLTFLVIPVVVITIYFLASSIYFRAKFPLRSHGFDHHIKTGVFGRTVHPTCMTLAIIGWVFFIYYPTWQVFISSAWATLVIFFWIKVEQDAYGEKKEEDTESGGAG